MCYKNQNEVEQAAMDAWMDEVEAAYMEEEFINERAREEEESKFDYFIWD